MDAGSIAFMIICAGLVFLMTPGLAFFYGGLGRRKNVINTMMMCAIPIAVGSVMWMIFGYSLSFGGSGSLIGNFSHLFFNGVSDSGCFVCCFPNDVPNHHSCHFNRGSSRTYEIYTTSYFRCSMAFGSLLPICSYGLGRRTFGSMGYTRLCWW